MTERKRALKTTMEFTELGLERLKPPKSGQKLYWEKAKLYRGLSLLVSSLGTKTFRSQYRLNGKWQTRTLGRFDENAPDGERIGVAWAHNAFLKDREQAEQGIDPNPKRKRQQEPEKPTEQAQTDPDLYGAVVDQFIEHYAQPRQRTWAQTERALKVNCKGWLNKPIKDITKKDAYALLDPLVAKGQGPTAGVTLAWLRTLWKWAYKRDLVAAPMMEQVEIHFEKRTRERVYSDDEIKTIWQAAKNLDPYREAFVKLLVLLAPRKTALAHARWSHLDDPENPTLWTTPHELTKSKKTANKKRTYLTPLPPLAQRILKGLPPREDAPTLLFPGRKKGEPLDPGTPLSRKLGRLGAPEDFNYHAMRHTVATWLENNGHSPFEIGLVLNHSGSGVTAGYSHGYPLELKRTLLNKWADHVEGLLTAEGVSLLR